MQQQLPSHIHNEDDNDSFRVDRRRFGCSFGIIREVIILTFAMIAVPVLG